MTARDWTPAELKVLRLFATLGPEQVAELLDRDLADVVAKAAEENITLERTDADIDLGLDAPKLLQWIRQSTSLTLCPSCTRRLAMVKTTGLCRVCHLDQLIALRDEQLEVIVREKKLAAKRKQKQRLRVCYGCGDAFYPRENSTATLCGRCSGAEPTDADLDQIDEDDNA